ncbi:hypothetical protein [Salibacterium aidingense]|uniref:hypothetical protein n=1 Tax=Salibacterium aidingense TaxID=384933 RepID=UPI0003F8C17A|nr:hypothetical protein [Salibacterium aidingense]
MKKLKRTILVLATGFLVSTSNVTFAAEGSTHSEPLETNSSATEMAEKPQGELILKYTAEDMDWDSATKKQKRILKEQGWELENGVPVLTRSVSEHLEKAEQEYGMKIENYDQNNGDQGTLQVNGEEKTIHNGTFDVESNDETIEVKIGEEEKEVKKQENGSYEVIVKKSASQMFENMDSKHEDMIGTLAYGETYSDGDWVHCNRFNGPQSNDKHLRKTNPQAYINFVLSDCDMGALFNCITHNTCNQEEMAAYCSLQIGHETLYHKH